MDSSKGHRRAAARIGAGKVRIIGGKYRSRLLRVPVRPGLRPTPDRVREDSERDRFFDAQGAVKYGICDEVIGEESAPGAAIAAADASKPK